MRRSVLPSSQKGFQTMALKLTLSPSEKLVVNGAVIQNGDRRASVVVQNKASILREKDILLPSRP